jgi:hypothetical protein
VTSYLIKQRSPKEGKWGRKTTINKRIYQVEFSHSAMTKP